MNRIMLRVAYDGTSYCGWQLQDNGVTIESKLNEAIGEITGENVQVTGASRTDSGVHALAAVCIFDTESRIPPEKFAYALNTRLPDDIRIRESRLVEPDFHPRHTDSVKTYEYKIWNDTFDNPLISRYAHFSYRKIDAEKMNEAGQYLVGEHDFAAFCSTGSSATTTVRRVTKLSVKRDESDSRIIRIRVSGEGFLYNMVRIIAGTLLEVGTGLRTVESVNEALESCNRQQAGPTAPAKGLTLIGIKYKVLGEL